jgi:hypothetical protein
MNKKLCALLTLAIMAFAQSSSAQSVDDVYANFEIDASPRARASILDGFVGGRIPSQDFEFCTVAWGQGLINEINRRLNISDILGALGSAHAAASYASACALETRKRNIGGTMGKPEYWASIAGQAQSVLIKGASQPGGSLESLPRALVYLKFAVANGSPDLQSKVDSLEKLKASLGPTQTPTKADFTSSAKSLVADLTSNSMGFWVSHRDKAISVNGEIIQIYGDEKVATFTLDGRPSGVTLDQANFRHLVACEVTDQSQIEKVALLKKGQKVKAIGIATEGYLGQVKLKGCALQ